MQNDIVNSKYNVYFDDSCWISNTITGSVVALAPCEYAAFKDKDWKAIEHIQTELLQQGILIDNELDEVALLRNAYSMRKLNTSEARLTICTTLECNFCCPYCYETRQSGAMSKKVQDGVLAHVESLLCSGIKKIVLVWYGGEPLLYPSIVKYISEKAFELCRLYASEYSCSMITNGFLIDTRTIDLFNCIHLNTLQITIDGNENTHNSRRKLNNGGKTFERIVENIKMLSNMNFFITVRVNLDRSNIDEYFEVENLFKETPNIHCIPAIVTQEETQETFQREKCFTHDEYSTFYERFNYSAIFASNFSGLVSQGICSCAAEHFYSCVIDPSGFRYQCLNDVGKKQYAIGSLLDSTICNPVSVAKYLGRDPFTEKECCECVYLPLCYGRCVWEYWDKHTHACSSVKFSFENAIRKRFSESINR